MSYRKITVGGVEYLWAVGKTYTKVRQGRHGKSIMYENAVWGTPIISRSYDVTDEKWDRALGRHVLADDGYIAPQGFVVATGDVKGMITGVRHWQEKPCREHPYETVTGLTSDVYDSEINDKTTLVGNCRFCQFQSYLDT